VTVLPKVASQSSFEVVAPRADVLMESLRATGYSLPHAVSDLIDNSIAAGARNIWLNFHWAGENSWASILDDGSGMSESDLINAMRIGSRSPLEMREPSDLGRYGLGLKTASILGYWGGGFVVLPFFNPYEPFYRYFFKADRDKKTGRQAVKSFP